MIVSSPEPSGPPGPWIASDRAGRLELGAGPLRVVVLPGRGLDVGAASFDGVQLAWLAAGGEQPTVSSRAADWLTHFHGGLVTTCGLGNVGQPSEGFGLHGRMSLTAASDVEVARDAAGHLVAVRGVVTDGPLTCRRTTTVGPAGLVVDDLITNLGDGDELAPLLYHVNIGPPLLSDDLTVAVDSVAVRAAPGTAPGAAEAWRRPARADPERETVLEHVLAPGSAGVSVEAFNPGLGLSLRICAAGLDRLHQWIDLRPGWGVLSLEPANCSLQGRAAERRSPTAPWLRPGQSRRTRLAIDVARHADIPTPLD